MEECRRLVNALKIGSVCLIVLAAASCSSEDPEPLAAADASPTAPASPAAPDPIDDVHVGSEAAVGGVLGLRCGYASRFLRERYDLAPGKGCVVLRVLSDSAAERAGFRLGDKIVAIDGTPITSGRQFNFLFEAYAGPRELRFAVERADEQLDLQVRLGSSGELPGEDDDPYFYYLRAKSRSGGFDLSDAVEDYTRAIEIEPEFDLAYLGRGSSRVRTAAIADEDPIAAAADLIHVLELDPELSETYRELAYAYATKRTDLGRAIDYVQQAMKLDGCVAPIAAWDLDCAEGFLTRAELYLDRLSPGDDRLADADMTAVAAVSLYEPRMTFDRFRLAYVRNDDNESRALLRTLEDVDFFGPNQFLSEERDVAVRIISENQTVIEWSANWFYGQQFRPPAPSIPGPDIGYWTDFPEPGLSYIAFQVRVPADVSAGTLAWVLKYNGYRVHSGEGTQSFGDLFQIQFGGWHRTMPPGAYEVSVYGDDRRLLTTGALTVCPDSLSLSLPEAPC